MNHQNPNKRDTPVKARGNKRSPFQREKDTENAIYAFSMGFTLIETRNYVNDEIKKRGDKYTLSHSQVHYDLNKCIEAKLKEAKKNTFSALDEVIEKYEFLYKEALISHRTQIKPSAGFLAQANEALKNLAKLKGVLIDKSEVTINGLGLTDSELIKRSKILEELLNKTKNEDLNE